MTEPRSALQYGAIRQKAHGRWPSIIAALGIVLPPDPNKHVPCPTCGGRDRFRFDDLDGRGTWYCHQCEPQAGDGFALVQKILNCNHDEAFRRVEGLVNREQFPLAVPSRKSANQEAKWHGLWDAAVPDTGLIDTYLRGRGLSGAVPATFRLHSTLPYYDNASGARGTYPAMLAPVVDRDGAQIGLHRTYLDPGGNGKASVTEPKKSLGSIAGGAIRLRPYQPGQPLGIAEGIETALAILEATGWQTWACVSANGLESVRLPDDCSPIYIGVDHDVTATGIRAATKLAARLFNEGRIVHTVESAGPIPAGTKSVDWLDVFSSAGAGVVRETFNRASPWTPTTMSGLSVRDRDEWPEPQPIKAELLPVDPLPTNIIPSAFRAWIEDVSDRMQCPIDYVAAAMVVMVGSIIGAGCGIRPKQHDDWVVVPNLWGGVVGRPSMLKTPAIAEAMKPLEALESMAKTEYDMRKKEYGAEAEALKARREALQKAMRQVASSKTPPNGTAPPKMDNLIQEFASLEEPKDLVWRRYKTNDATIEKMAELQSENARGLLLFRDELIGLFATWDKEGHESDRAFYLEAWNGVRPYTSDRIGRGTVHVDNLCVSLFGGIQPGKLCGYLHAAMRGHNNDGMVQRLQVFVYPDEPRGWILRDRPIDKAAKHQAYRVVQRLSSMDFRQYGALSEEGTRIPYCHFDPDAQQVFYEWLTELEGKLRSDDEPVVLEHLGKYRSLMPALAIVFHLITIADDPTPSGRSVSLKSAKQAAAWCEYLESHARRIYGMATNLTTQAAKRLSVKLQDGALPSPFTVRDVYRKGWGLLDDRQIVEHACEELISFGWLREKVTPPAAGFRGKTEYFINPKVRS